MHIKYNIAIDGITNALQEMAGGGLYCLSIEDRQDADLLTRQILLNQDKGCAISLVVQNHDADHFLYELFNEDQNNTLMSAFKLRKNFYKYQMTNENKAILHFAEDLKRLRYALTKNRPNQSKGDDSKRLTHIVVLNISAESFKYFGAVQLKSWFMDLKLCLESRQMTLIILNHGIFSLSFSKQLLLYYPQINGLVCLTRFNKALKYHIHWWMNDLKVSAGKTLFLTHKSEPFLQLILAEESQNKVSLPQLKNSMVDYDAHDEHLYYANQHVLEGAPALSKYWQLFEDNEDLFKNVSSVDSASVIFCIDKMQQVTQLVRQIHYLRKMRGKSVKLVVREMKPCLRYADERLLQACGATAIIAHTENLSRFLTQLEGLQDQIFNKNLIDDIETLLQSVVITKEKGLVVFEFFISEIHRIIHNPFLPQDNKGILVMLKPVKGLKLTQALSLCHFKREGDLVIFADQQLYLFLCLCRINDLNMALSRLFQLPIADIFINTQSWHQDDEILKTLESLKLSQKNVKSNVNFKEISANDYGEHLLENNTHLQNIQPPSTRLDSVEDVSRTVPKQVSLVLMNS